MIVMRDKRNFFKLNFPEAYKNVRIANVQVQIIKNLFQKMQRIKIKVTGLVAWELFSSQS